MEFSEIMLILHSDYQNPLKNILRMCVDKTQEHLSHHNDYNKYIRGTFASARLRLLEENLGPQKCVPKTGACAEI